MMELLESKDYSSGLELYYKVKAEAEDYLDDKTHLKLAWRNISLESLVPFPFIYPEARLSHPND